MTLIQSSFIFDYLNYQNMIHPLIDELDRGNVEPLISSVKKIRSDFPDEKKWILHNKGTQLNGDFGLDRDPKFQAGLIGHWLLILLSTYLETNISLGSDYSKFSRLLHEINWSIDDIHTLLRGNPTSQLIKPGVKSLRRSVSWEDPYWFWLRPLYSNYQGWLTFNDVTKFREMLNLEKPVIENFKDLSISDQEKDTTFSSAIEMLQLAINSQKGLFIIVYEEDE